MLLLAVSAASHTFTVDVSQPALRPVEGLYEIAIPGMHPLENNDGVSLPGDYIFYPVPPGSIPELKWTVEAVGRTGWSSEVNFSSEPVLTGYGFNTSEDRVQAAFPEEHQPVAMDVVHLLGSTVARISVSPFCYGSPGMFASRLSITLTYPDRSGGISTEGTLFSHLSPEADRWWRYRTRSEESPFWGKPWARIRVDASGFYSVTGQEIIDAGCDITGAPSPSLAMFSGPATMFDPLNPADSQNLYPVSMTVSSTLRIHWFSTVVSSGTGVLILIPSTDPTTDSIQPIHTGSPGAGITENGLSSAVQPPQGDSPWHRELFPSLSRKRYCQTIRTSVQGGCGTICAKTHRAISI